MVFAWLTSGCTEKTIDLFYILLRKWSQRLEFLVAKDEIRSKFKFQLKKIMKNNLKHLKNVLKMEIKVDIWYCNFSEVVKRETSTKLDLQTESKITIRAFIKMSWIYWLFLYQVYI